MNKLPKVFVNKIDKKFNNEQIIYKDDTRDNPKLVSIKEINQKIESIFKDKSHIYKSRVKITLKDKELVCDIVGKTGNSILTLDNEIIKITDIIDIEKV
jgi:hypothetical protein